MPLLRYLVLAAFFVGLPAYAQILEVCTISPKTTPPSLSCTMTGAVIYPRPGASHIYAQPIVAPAVTAIEGCTPAIPATSTDILLDASSLQKLTPSTDFTLTPQGKTVLLVTRTPAAPGAKPRSGIKKSDLTQFDDTVALILAKVPPIPGTFSVEIGVPHAASLGSLATQISSNSSIFAAKSSGRDRIFVTTIAGPVPACNDWKAFLRDVRDLAWGIHPEPGEFRITQIPATSAATALGASTAPAATPSPNATANTAPTTPSTPALTITVTPPQPAVTSGASPAGKSTPATPTATTISVAAAAPPAAIPSAASAAPATVAGSVSPGVAIAAIAPDVLLFSDANPGDDAAIVEKKRLAAMMDLPRAEMSISAWVMQNSSTDPDSTTESSRLVRQEVRNYNDGLEAAILDGWRYLKRNIAGGTYFDPTFHDYLTKRVIFDNSQVRVPASSPHDVRDLLYEDVAQSDPLTVAAGLAATPAPHSREDYLGACPQNQYCLGFTTLFDPLKPRLTDLLLTLVAAKNPTTAIDCAIDFAERDHSVAAGTCLFDPRTIDRSNLLACDPKESWSPCRIWPQLTGKRDGVSETIPTSGPRFERDCQQGDYLGILQSMLVPDGQGRPDLYPPVMYLNCFRTKAKSMLVRGAANDPVNALGLLRAALADFLFNYKMSQQYPHEFVPYDLTMSAQAMNTSIRPLVEAFEEDVDAYQAVLKRKLGLKISDMNRRLTKGSPFDKPRFFNNAIVTVNTIADNESTVDTTTESYLEALNPPTLSGMANALLGTPASSAAPPIPSGTALSGLLSNTRLGEAQAVAAGVAQYQSSKIHIGRELSIDVTPETLAGGNAAELQVTLKADDEASSGAYSSGSAGDAEVSRLGKSDTSTLVRVDSLKMFEVSSFASQIVTPKKRFPLLPLPGLEMPYFGSIVSVPLRPAREFHSSIAIVSAIVMPTAADVAFGVRFLGDRILVAENPAQNDLSDVTAPCFWPIDSTITTNASRPQCKTRSMVSLHDFDGLPVREFNRMKIQCLATNGVAATPNSIPLNDPINSGICSRLSYRDVLGDVE